MAYLDEDFLFTQTYLTQACGITIAAFKQWNIPVKARAGRGGKCDIRDVITYLRGKRNSVVQDSDGTKISASEAKARSDLALAQKREAELALLKKELIYADQVQEQWEKQIIALRQAILTMPTRLARIYSVVDDAKEFKKEALDECKSALENLSSIDLDEIDVLEEIEKELA